MYFYDTCALLNLQDVAFKERFTISAVTLQEIEEIKTSGRKDEDTRYKARNAARLLKERKGEYNVAGYTCDDSGMPTVYSSEDNTNDATILTHYSNTVEWIDPSCVFVTDDNNLFNLAALMAKGSVTDTSTLLGGQDEYTGYVLFDGSNEELAEFYEDLCVNTLGLGVNQYVFIEEIDGDMVGYRWTGEEYQLLYHRPLRTRQFGDDFKPKDVYQKAVVDSIMNNQITAITGPAGSGKSLLSLVCAFNLIERGLYDRIVMLINPAKAYGAVDMGYYPGSVHEKITESFAGHMLATKLGDQFEIDRLVDGNKLQLVSMADMRGMEIREREILYITECQNTSAELLKLCLSRVGDGAKVIIEGDYKSQVDSHAFRGARNGMKRAIDVLRGSSLFGYVELKQIWRSELAELVSAM